MKGDAIEVTTESGGQVATTRIVAETSGASVTWASDRQWLTVEELNAANKIKRTAKFASGHVVSMVETRARARED